MAAEPTRETVIIIGTGDRDLGRLLQITLEGLGQRGVICHSASEILRRALADGPGALILDARLPDSSAADLIRQLQTFESTRRLPTLLLPGVETPGGLELEPRPGIDFFLSPPITPRAIRGVLERV